MREMTFGPASALIAEMDSPDWPEALHGRVWQVHRLQVPADQRGRGYGSALMGRIQKHARKRGKLVLVNVKPEDDGMTVEQLEGWYQRLGFIRIQDEPLLMVRQ